MCVFSYSIGELRWAGDTDSNVKTIHAGGTSVSPMRDYTNSNPMNVFKAKSGQIFPKAFISPDSEDTPRSLFRPSMEEEPKLLPSEWTSSSLNKFLVCTDGACLRNGAHDANAGCAFVFARPSKWPYFNVVRFLLEDRDLNNQMHRRTSNRAELRAAIHACQVPEWTREGFDTMVIATDSEYVVKGATEWIHDWIKNGWWRSPGNPVEDRDLWEWLLREMDRLAKMGISVEYWHISRKLNEIADRHAKIAARKRL
ncbi:hypothetical protein N7478_007022 [Penicillium angulare]|uniref:uncharacterized protein n=1 Tax=Penicillium angulare TaxID=116970 RepID=UPI00253FEC99|nr:uncharacterized protein N7478_007022 [Penicillium angulare]KAJ5281650.1 hypothetical protein N7478_007022 [Penicillium angulare]